MTHIATIQPLQIKVDGLPLAAAADEALREVLINQRLSESSLCVLTFVEPQGGDFIRESRLMPGGQLQLISPDRQQNAFSGTIKEFEYYYGPAGERVLKVNANDDLYALYKRQQVKAHIQMTVPELAESMLAEFGISVAAPPAASPVWDHIVQHRMSDLAFLKDYAERSGLYFFLLGDTLHFYTLKPDAVGIELEYRQTLLELTLKRNSDWCVDSVTVDGWNPWRAVNQTGQAQTHHIFDAFAASRRLSDQPAQSDDQLDMLALAELDRSEALRQSINGTVEGDFRLMPGATVSIVGIDASLNGLYRLTTVTHRINADQGFVTEFGTAPPKLSQRVHHTLATMARVTQVDDPERLGRIKVILPGYNDVETDWLEVVMPAAGVNKGLVVLPDIDDKVMLLMLNGRPDQGIVLGGLYGEEGPPDHNVQDDSVHRFSFLTPGGQAIRMNDRGASISLVNRNGCSVELSGDTIKLETSEGHSLEMDDQILRIHAQTDCCIEAPGQTLTLKAEKINFERG
ncbi:MAG: phage baseplate assembly protein V [Gammaproteobacteria bacterium]